MGVVVGGRSGEVSASGGLAHSCELAGTSVTNDRPPVCFCFFLLRCLGFRRGCGCECVLGSFGAGLGVIPCEGLTVGDRISLLLPVASASSC